MDRLNDYADLEELGLGSRWTVRNRVKDGIFPKPDCYLGGSPRWKTQTLKAYVEALPKERVAEALHASLRGGTQ